MLYYAEWSIRRMVVASKNLFDPSIFGSARHCIPSACRERFFPLSSPVAAALVRHHVELGGVSDLVPGYLMARPRPRFHMVLYTVSGRGRFAARDGMHPLGPGVLAMSPAGIPHAFAPSGPRWRMLWFHLADRPAWAHLKDRGPLVQNSQWLSRLLPSAEGLLEEGLADDQGEAGRLYAELITLFLTRELGAGREGQDAVIRHRLQEVWRLVDARLGHPWTVAELAAHACVSQTHLHRLVRQHCHISPMAMVTRLRMVRARELLRQGLAVHQVAAQVGYDNPFSFSTAFRRYWGASPRESR